ncbi:aminopeptidase P family protein [Candidatus Sumerlaeota bacterium]|nr:aminopeptidase P family protein [Candidatus Sumerlaeota bacterium]
MKSRAPKRRVHEVARRISRLQSALKRRRLDAMIVFDRHNTFYLTGMRCSLSYLMVTPRSARLLIDGRYIEAARSTVRHCEVELMKKLPRSLRAWQREFEPRKIALEGSIPWNAWKQFGELIPGVEWQEAGSLILKMRLIKSRDEIRRIAESAKLNDEIYEAAVAAAAPGCTEIDLRNVIRSEADRRGADGLSFDSIVASGTAGSMPHYVPSENRLKPGEMLLVDMGMQLDGYCSDMTRVVALGARQKKRMRKAFDAVLDAEEAALKEVGPGVRAADLHRIATDRLKRHGLARYFTHGLGHGVGLEIHEAPTLNATSTDVLRAGMVVTIEPGVYLPGLGGVRIEDMVAVTRSGCRVLSRAPKTYRTVPFGE